LGEINLTLIHYGEYRSKKKGIQAWCADMWAVLWNLWLMSKKVEIHKEMDFSWPYDGVDQWHKKAIQHYSGNIEDKSKHFKKTEYLNYMPWYDSDLNHIPNTTCSYEIVKLIKARRIELDDARTSFHDTVIFLETEQADSVTRSTFEIHKNYIQKYLNINVLLLSKSINDQLNNKDEIILTHELCQLTEVWANCDSFIVIPLAHLIKIDELTQLISSPIINQSFSSDKHYKIDMLFNEAFSKMLEIELFEENKGKLNIVQKQDPIFKLNSSYIKYYQNNYREIVQSMLSPLGVTYLLP
jgi:hypothetical protein